MIEPAVIGRKHHWGLCGLGNSGVGLIAVSHKLFVRKFLCIYAYTNTFAYAYCMCIYAYVFIWTYICSYVHAHGEGHLHRSNNIRERIRIKATTTWKEEKKHRGYSQELLNGVIRQSCRRKVKGDGGKGKGLSTDGTTHTTELSRFVYVYNCMYEYAYVHMHIQECVRRTIHKYLHIT